uniref:Inner membrane complex protein, putative n=1 Tax=Theileria annulata TaxID=5874 RepID=A0A3B0MXR9_THEAN
MVFCNYTCCNDEKVNRNVYIGEYNLGGIPFHDLANLNELNCISGTVIRDMQRAIILKPITREKIVEVMVEEIQEKIVEVPQVQVVDKYVEVVKPIIKYKIKEVKRPVTVEKIKKVPKIVEEEKTIEVPEIQYVEKFVDVTKVVQKEKIIEIPLPIVKERRIPVLNVSREERIQEVDGLEYKFGSESSFTDGSSIGIQSSLSSTLCIDQNSQILGQDSNDKDVNDESNVEDKSSNQSNVVDDSSNESNIRYDSNVVDDSNIGDDKKNEDGEDDYSEMEYLSSKVVNYNSSENEDRIDEISENSNRSLGIESHRNSITLYNGENRIEIEQGSEILEQDDYPNMESLSLGEDGSKSSLNEEKIDEEIRRAKFESRVMISPEIEAKLVENISSQLIPETIKAFRRNRRQKQQIK